MIMNNYVLITFLYSQEFPHQLSNPVRASVNVLKSIFLNIVSFGIYFLGEFKSKPFLCFDFLSILCQRILVDTLRMRNRDCERVSDRLREEKRERKAERERGTVGKRFCERVSDRLREEKRERGRERD